MKHNPFLIIVLALALYHPACATDAMATADQIDKLFAETMKPSDTSAVVDREAKTNTRQLGMDNPQWNDSNPAWPGIYAKVRRDTETDMKPFNDYMATQMQKDMETDIAAHLTAADANQILSYYASDQGKAFLSFNKDVNKLFSSGMSGMLEHEPSPSAAPLTANETVKYHKLLVESHPFQLISVMQQADKTNDGAVGAIMLAMIISKYPQELAKLSDVYGSQLDGFTKFNASAPAHNFIAAEAAAAKDNTDKMKRIQQANEASMQKHRAEWQALYKSNVAAH